MTTRKPPKPLREENVEATRRKLLATARKHFGRSGYSKAEIGLIAADARLTTGAVYHHFGSKKGLFQAVAEEIEVEIIAQSSDIDEADPWRRLQLSFERLIDYCAAPDVQRITFIEAPQVLGPEAWREIELRYALGALERNLPALMAAGLVKPLPAALVARTMLALLHEASAEVARTKRDPKVRAQVSELTASIFKALQP